MHLKGPGVEEAAVKTNSTSTSSKRKDSDPLTACKKITRAAAAKKAHAQTLSFHGTLGVERSALERLD